MVRPTTGEATEDLAGQKGRRRSRNVPTGRFAFHKMVIRNSDPFLSGSFSSAFYLLSCHSLWVNLDFVYSDSWSFLLLLLRLPSSPDDDIKFERFVTFLLSPLNNNHKRLLFTTDTSQHLRQALIWPSGRRRRELVSLFRSNELEGRGGWEGERRKRKNVELRAMNFRQYIIPEQTLARIENYKLLVEKRSFVRSVVCLQREEPFKSFLLLHLKLLLHLHSSPSIGKLDGFVFRTPLYSAAPSVSRLFAIIISSRRKLYQRRNE